MGKHLAPEAKKTETKKPRAERVVQIPVRPYVRKGPSRRAGEADAPGRDMLNKTLDRTFSTSDLILGALSLFLLILAWFLPTTGLIRLLSFLLPFLLAGYSYLYEAFQEAFLGIVLGRELIVSLASLMAFCGGSSFSGAAVMVFMKLCDLALAFTESLHNEKVEALYALRPESASLVRDGVPSAVPAGELQIGDVIELAPGDVVPADGVVISGASSLDASALTGGSHCFPVAAGSAAVSGCRNLTASLRIRVERTQDDSVSAALIRSAENSWMHRSPQELLLGRVLSYVSPALVVLALLFALIPSVITGEWRSYLVRAAILLTVSQSFSVVQSIKLCYDCAAACAAAKGVLFKGHDVFEALSRAETMVFDKTGTVTEGIYRIKEVFPRGVSSDQLLFLAGAAELRSRHPIAKAIVSASGVYASDINVVDIRETPGRGVCAFLDGRSIYVGNAALMDEHGIAYASPSITGSVIHVAVDQHYIGHIVLEDALREGAFDALEELRIAGVSTGVLLTGDVHSSARKIASVLNFDMVKAELSPEEKCKSVEYLMTNRNVNTTLAFVGDGVCDTEALRLATVGVAFACFDKPEAIEVCDAAILGGDIKTLPRAYRIAGRAARSAFENAVVCAAVKLAVLIFGAAGVFSLGFAVLLQTAAVLLEALNALRVLYYEDKDFSLRKEKNK